MSAIIIRQMCTYIYYTRLVDCRWQPSHIDMNAGTRVSSALGGLTYERIAATERFFDFRNRMTCQIKHMTTPIQVVEVSHSCREQASYWLRKHHKNTNSIRD
jgi:hypothetical protein